MAQWDVYANPSARLGDEIPFLVELQSDLLNQLGTRFVAPLARTSVAAVKLPRRLCPAFTVKGLSVVLLPQEAGPVDARVLKRRITSLRARSREIVDALDAVISGV